MPVPKRTFQKFRGDDDFTVHQHNLMKGQLQSSEHEIRSLRKRKGVSIGGKQGIINDDHYSLCRERMNRIVTELWSAGFYPPVWQAEIRTWGSPTASKRNWGETLAAETGNTTAKIDKMGNSICWWKCADTDNTLNGNGIYLPGKNTH